MIIKIIIINPKPTKSPIIIELFHACTVPPHCKASKRHTTELPLKPNIGEGSTVTRRKHQGNQFRRIFL